MAEVNPNPFPPEMSVLPKPIEAVARVIANIWQLGRTVELCTSEHNRGAAPMLDAELKDGGVQPPLF